MYACAECGELTDWATEPSTYCSTCKENFCQAYSCYCFVRRHRKTGCRGTAITIINPQWICNLIKTRAIEGKETSQPDSGQHEK